VPNRTLVFESEEKIEEIENSEDGNVLNVSYSKE